MAEVAWNWCLRQSIASSLDAGHSLIEQLITALQKAGWDGRDLFHVQLATEEAMVNAITHGNKLSADKIVEVEFKVHPVAAEVRIKDQGEGFRPENLPDPRDNDHLECTNGRGVMLICAMMDKVEYSPIGNQVTMIKRRYAG